MTKKRSHLIWTVRGGHPRKGHLWVSKATLPLKAVTYGQSYGVKHVMTYHGHWAVRCVATGQVFAFPTKDAGLMFMALQV